MGLGLGGESAMGVEAFLEGVQRQAGEVVEREKEKEEEGNEMKE